MLIDQLSATSEFHLAMQPHFSGRLFHNKPTLASIEYFAPRLPQIGSLLDKDALNFLGYDALPFSYKVTAPQIRE